MEEEMDNLIDDIKNCFPNWVEDKKFGGKKN